MHAITVRDRNAGPAGMSLTDMPYPHPAEGARRGVHPGDAAVAGAVLLPREAGYVDERAVFNLNHELAPAVAVKRTHDPTTMFRLDHDVLPAD